MLNEEKTQNGVLSEAQNGVLSDSSDRETGSESSVNDGAVDQADRIQIWVIIDQ